MPDLFVAPETNQLNNTINDQQLSGVTQAEGPLPLTHNTHIFTTYCEYPKNVHFGTQEPNEQVLLFLRRDFITNVPWIISSILLLLAPTLFLAVATASNIQIAMIPQNISFIFSSFYFLIVATYIFINFITWYFNSSLVTTIRVVDVDFEDIIYKNISETKLNLVQDVSYKQIGAIQTFYDFGDVLIQTAAPVDTFDLNQVPRPQHVVEVIEELIGRRGRLHAV
ncbi:MAG TPA: hypothetical protein VLF89_00530 [Candidatus Saccharimonadales bacterium]|nr:hypothetical protein [Candidatus Saccharimonadales bacterium]